MGKEPPTRAIRPPTLRVDRDKYPGLETNPSLERALRIIQELERGRPREEAVEVAEMAMGASPKARKVRAPAVKPAGRPRAHGKAGKAPSAPKKRSHAPKRSHASPTPTPKKRRRSA